MASYEHSRRRCLKCDKRFTAYERPEIAMPTVVKKDGGRAEFDRSNLRASMLLALRKRPVSSCTAPRLIAMCIVTRYNRRVIRTFRHKGLKAFFEKGSVAGIQAAHAPRLAAMLRRLNETTNAQGMNLPGWGLHPLKGRDLKGHFSVWVNGNWRMTFAFDGTDAVLVNYLDYH